MGAENVWIQIFVENLNPYGKNNIIVKTTSDIVKNIFKNTFKLISDCIVYDDKMSYFNTYENRYNYKKYNYNIRF